MKTERLLLILALGAVAVLSVVVLRGRGTDLRSGDEGVGSDITYGETEHDFGVVLQSGGLVSHTFPYTYTGTTERTVIGVSTSCGCTTGEIDREILRPGDTGVVTITFDPNLHAEPEGRFFKTAEIVTEPRIEGQKELRIWAEIDLDLGPEAYTLSTHDDDHEGDHVDGSSVHALHAEELAEMLERKAYAKPFYLLDTHIPEQEHIQGTDAFIPFNEIALRAEELPADKHMPIVVYCRSGSMSAQAAEALIDLGYTEVYDLQGGIRAFNAL